MVRAGALLLALSALSSTTTAADLNAPATKTVTVGSEMKRGHDVAFNCAMQSHARWEAYGDCIDRALSDEQRRNTDTDAFILGAYDEAYESLEITRGAWLKTNGTDLMKDGLFALTENLYLTERQKRQKSLGLSDAQICGAVLRANCSPLPTPAQ